MIDFGLSVKFLTSEGNHYEKGKEDSFIGNEIFACRRSMLHQSTNIFKIHIEQCRADDLEALFYMLMLLYHGELPWKVKYNSAANFDIIKQYKT